MEIRSDGWRPQILADKFVAQVTLHSSCVRLSVPPAIAGRPPPVDERPFSECRSSLTAPSSACQCQRMIGSSAGAVGANWRIWNSLCVSVIEIEGNRNDYSKKFYLLLFRGCQNNGRRSLVICIHLNRLANNWNIFFRH